MMKQAVQTDKQVMTKIFKELRKAGFFARQNFLCCQNCAWSKIENDYPDKKAVVFYHNQDNDAFDKQTKDLTKTLFLAWEGDGATIAKIVEENGFEVHWNGSENKRIGVLPRPENRQTT